MLLARVYEHGKGAWLVSTRLAFWVAWPLGFVVFAFLVGSGHLRGWKAKASSMSDRWSDLRGPGQVKRLLTARVAFDRTIQALDC